MKMVEVAIPIDRKGHEYIAWEWRKLPTICHSFLEHYFNPPDSVTKAILWICEDPKGDFAIQDDKTTAINSIDVDWSLKWCSKDNLVWEGMFQGLQDKLGEAFGLERLQNPVRVSVWLEYEE